MPAHEKQRARRCTHFVATVLGLLALPLTAGAQKAAASQAPPMAVSRMGQVMSAAAARNSIGFPPFLPPRTVVAVALLPPFRGDDTRANRGIGFEYLDAPGRRYVLAEWPENDGSIAGFAELPFHDPRCPSARTVRRGTSPNGIVWTTARGLVMTLVADGPNDARTLENEWRKLIRRGVCR